jgi:hypothetical protein
VGWSRCFEVDVPFVVAAWGIAVDWVVESRFGEVQGAWCQRVRVEPRHLVGIVVAEAQVEVDEFAVGADVALQRHRMELVHYVEEGNLEVRMAVAGIAVLRDS